MSILDDNFYSLFIQVQARTWKCASVSCNCGVAIREGDDVIVVDMCRDKIPRARFASKKEPAAGVTVKRDPTGKIFIVSIIRDILENDNTHHLNQ